MSNEKQILIMASVSETGHANNVANFESLITTATAFGTAYNPSKDNLKLPALQALLSASRESLNAVNIAQSAYSNAVSARESAFDPFGKRITRVNNALKASGTTAQVNESAQTIVRKLQGKRASAKLTDEAKQALEAEGKEVTQISASQLSYDSRLENFDKLIMLLVSIPLYKPNEEDLKIESLKALYNEFKGKNNDVLLASIQLSNARISRNDILYKPITGLVDVASDIKIYLKSVFGATSPQFKQVSKLNFTIRN
jgi:hypothetical protein